MESQIESLFFFFFDGWKQAEQTPTSQESKCWWWWLSSLGCMFLVLIKLQVDFKRKYF